MSIAIVQNRLLSYQSNTLLEQENALKEIAQEIALLALARSGFFKGSAFQGGTCLRILYGLERFSEDLDFVLESPDKTFSWPDFINNMREEFNTYGYKLEVEDRKKLDKNIRTAFLKADSVGGLLILNDTRSNKPKLKIKLEIDTNPPAGSNYEFKYLDFPLSFGIKTQDLPSLFAGKCHALLCRKYTKGRDWYDFIWYVSKQTPINFILLKNALLQAGPWANQDIELTTEWFLQELTTKIESIDWQAAKQDVERFLRPREVTTLELWSVDFLVSRVEKLRGYLNQSAP